MIAVEGAFGLFDFRPFHLFGDPQVAAYVSRAYLKKGLLGAPSFLGLTSTGPLPPIVGIDDEELYHQNVDAYLDSLSQRHRAQEKLGRFQKAVRDAKARSFSPKLREFDRMRDFYRRDQLSLKGYLSYLAGFGLSKSSPLASAQEAMEMESRLNWDEIQETWKRLLPHLLKSADSKSLHETVKYMPLLAKDGSAVPYELMAELVRRFGMDLNPHPVLRMYLAYLEKAKTAQPALIIRELERQEERIAAQLTRTAHEERLLALSDYLYLTEKLIAFRLTPDEWDRYLSLKQTAGLDKPLPVSPFEAFYEKAVLRSTAMGERLLALPENASTALIFGGFHTRHITEFLKKHRRPFVVLSPHLAHAPGGRGGDYLSLFSKKKTREERLFAGEQLFLYPKQIHVGGNVAALSTGRQWLVEMRGRTPVIRPRPGLKLDASPLGTERVQVYLDDEINALRSVVNLMKPAAEGIEIVEPIPSVQREPQTQIKPARSPPPLLLLLLIWPALGFAPVANIPVFAEGIIGPLAIVALLAVSVLAFGVLYFRYANGISLISSGLNAVVVFLPTIGMLLSHMGAVLALKYSERAGLLSPNYFRFLHESSYQLSGAFGFFLGVVVFWLTRKGRHENTMKRALFLNAPFAIEAILGALHFIIGFFLSLFNSPPLVFPLIPLGPFNEVHIAMVVGGWLVGLRVYPVGRMDTPPPLITQVKARFLLVGLPLFSFALNIGLAFITSFIWLPWIGSRVIGIMPQSVFSLLQLPWILLLLLSWWRRLPLSIILISSGVLELASEIFIFCCAYETMPSPFFDRNFSDFYIIFGFIYLFRELTQWRLIRGQEKQEEVIGRSYGRTIAVWLAAAILLIGPYLWRANVDKKRAELYPTGTSHLFQLKSPKFFPALFGESLRTGSLRAPHEVARFLKQQV